MSRNQGGTSIATASAEQNGSGLSFLGAHASFQNRVRAEGEYVISWFDPDVVNGTGRKVDKAGRARLELQDAPFQVWEKPVQFRLGGEYLFTGLFYRSLTNPGITTDRQGVNAEGGTAWGPGSVSLNATRLHDNVKDLEVSPASSPPRGAWPSPWPSPTGQA